MPPSTRSTTQNPSKATGTAAQSSNSPTQKSTSYLIASSTSTTTNPAAAASSRKRKLEAPNQQSTPKNSNTSAPPPTLANAPVAPAAPTLNQHDRGLERLPQDFQRLFLRNPINPHLKGSGIQTEFACTLTALETCCKKDIGEFATKYELLEHKVIYHIKNLFWTVEYDIDKLEQCAREVAGTDDFAQAGKSARDAKKGLKRPQGPVVEKLSELKAELNQFYHTGAVEF